MTYTYYNIILASTYGSGAYNDNNYNGTNVTTTGGANGSAGGSLTNTGVAVAGIVAIAATILLIAMVVRIWKRPGRKLQAQEVQAEAPAPVLPDKE